MYSAHLPNVGGGEWHQTLRSENDIFICDRMGDIAEDETTFYSNAEGYWKDIPPTVDGMLGGYGSISSIDISGSKAFLLKLIGVRVMTFLTENCILPL